VVKPLLDKLLSLLRKGAEKIGVIKNIKSINELEDIAVNDEFYELINQWKALYRGYYPDWHDVTYHTIEGTKTRRMDSLNMAKTSAQEIASLVFKDRKSVG